MHHKQHKVLILPGKQRYFGKSGQDFLHFYSYTRLAIPNYTKQRPFGRCFYVLKHLIN